MVEFRVIIPARYNSKRLPGKLLLDLAGKPLIQHTYEQSLASGADSVVIATDDDRIAEAAEKFKAEVVMTSEEHESGTSRIAEAIEALDCEDDEIIVGVQADEPLIPPVSIAQVANNLTEHDNVKVATLCETITNADELFDPHAVKVVMNRRNYAMYFSRAPIPWGRDTFAKRENVELDGNYFRHVGIYGYRANFLSDYSDWTECPMEFIERLEQLRILWNGGRIHVDVSKQHVPAGVDTQDDYERVKALIK